MYHKWHILVCVCVCWCMSGHGGTQIHGKRSISKQSCIIFITFHLSDIEFRAVSSVTFWAVNGLLYKSYNSLSLSWAHSMSEGGRPITAAHRDLPDVRCFDEKQRAEGAAGDFGSSSSCEKYQYCAAK